MTLWTWVKATLIALTIAVAFLAGVSWKAHQNYPSIYCIDDRISLVNECSQLDLTQVEDLRGN